MSHYEYNIWFRENRIKRKMLPVYSDYRAEYINCIKDYWVKLRHLAVILIKRIYIEHKGLR